MIKMLNISKDAGYVLSWWSYWYVSGIFLLFYLFFINVGRLPCPFQYVLFSNSNRYM